MFLCLRYSACRPFPFVREPINNSRTLKWLSRQVGNLLPQKRGLHVGLKRPDCSIQSYPDSLLVINSLICSEAGTTHSAWEDSMVVWSAQSRAQKDGVRQWVHYCKNVKRLDWSAHIFWVMFGGRLIHLPWGICLADCFPGGMTSQYILQTGRRAKFACHFQMCVKDRLRCLVSLALYAESRKCACSIVFTDVPMFLSDQQV